MYHQAPPPAASNNVAAMAPIHNPFLLPPLAASVAGAQLDSSKLDPKLGASMLFMGTNSASSLAPKLYDSPSTCGSSSSVTSSIAGVSRGGATAARTGGAAAGATGEAKGVATEVASGGAAGGGAVSGASVT